MSSVTFNTAKSLISRTALTFTLKDLVKAKDIKHKNLFEMISMYPSKGIGFKIRKIDWPADKYYLLTEVDLESNRTGDAYGVLFEENQRAADMPVEIPESTSRGMWIYEIGDSSVLLDNGMRYTASHMMEFWKSEIKNISKRVVDIEADTEEYMNEIEQKKLKMKN